MKLSVGLGKKIKQSCFILIFILVLIFQTDFQNLKALNMTNVQNREVVEELRLKVPSSLKEVWLTVESQVWEPWLSSQDGFLGRQLFYNKEKEEALILVTWKNKKLWKGIPMSEVNLVQEKFEDNVKNAIKKKENPFELIYEGE